MRICPQCNQEYEDDFNFCLNDGSVLSKDSFASEFDKTPQINNSEETLVIQDQNRQSNIKTEVLPNPVTSPQDSVAQQFTDANTPKQRSKAKIIIPIAIVAILLFGGLGFAFWMMRQNTSSYQVPDKITKEEMELLIKDFNPMQLKQLSESPEQKKLLVDNISELLAIASQAKKDGFTDDPLIKEELEYFDKSLYAINYDRKINADKGPMPPFGYISEDQVKAFWEKNKGMEAEFKKFIDTKVALARKSGQIAKDQEPSEEELKQAKDAFAKTQIYYQEVMDKLNDLSSLPETERKDWEKFKKKTELQIKLQKAQFLTQSYVKDVLEKKFEVTDEEIEKYAEAHPELTNLNEKKKKAEEILARVKNGENFAKLAKEFSEDPGSKDKGGLYEGIAKGQFAPEFEAAAFALEPGQVADKVVKTNFGYHIIKLEKKGEQKGANGEVTPTFDARHILISTMAKDPDDPTKEMPIKDSIKAKLEKEKQEKILAEIKKNNQIQVAADFEIPKVSDEELEEYKKKQPQSDTKLNDAKNLRID